MATTPFTVPPVGQLTAITESVRWLRMPLPFALDHINLYLIRDVGGWAIIDTGLDTPTTRSAWESILSDLNEPVTRVIVTHMHPDHCGLAGWLSEKFEIDLYMSALEYYAARALRAGPNGAGQWQDKQYLVRTGERSLTETIPEPTNHLANVVSPLPLAFCRLREHQRLMIGHDEWQVMIGRGHSPEHVSLYNARQRILIAGDQVLPKISPNIGAYSTEPDIDALGDYLATLPQFLTLPSDTLVLPAHKAPFVTLHNRVNALITHHHDHLSNLCEARVTPGTVAESLAVMFRRRLTDNNRFFAIAECLAHLNYCHTRGFMHRAIDEQGRYVFTTCKPFTSAELPSSAQSRQ